MSLVPQCHVPYLKLIANLWVTHIRMCSIGTFWEYFAVSLCSGTRAYFPYGVARQTHWVSAQKCWLVPSRWAEKTTRASRLRRRWRPDGHEISIFNKRRHRPHYHNSSFPSQMDSSPLCCGFTLHVHVIKSPLKVWRRCFVPPSGWWWRKGGSETEGGAVRQGLRGSGCSSNSVSWAFTSNLSRSVLSCSIKWSLISINTKMHWWHQIPVPSGTIVLLWRRRWAVSLSQPLCLLERRGVWGGGGLSLQSHKCTTTTFTFTFTN